MNRLFRVPAGRKAGLVFVMILAAMSCKHRDRNEGHALAQTKSDSSRVVLDNGLVVLLHSVSGSDHIAMESFYRAGFLVEPKAMTQSAHLLEHLVCQCATKSFRVGETMAVLNQRGMANAETLPHFTHYDYVLPARDLELALRIEAERLTGLRITPEVIRQEAPKCYQEADFVERNPQVGMLKHAFMALSQLWQHGATQAQVRGGLEKIPVAQLEDFFRTAYRPDRAILVLVGGFQPAEALRLIKLHLGGIRPGEARAHKAINWSKVPKQATVRWDSRVQAVCLAFAPPDGALDRLQLTLWGNLLMQKLMMDPTIQGVANAVFCTNQMWNVGELPFFVYATARTNVKSAHLQRTLSQRLQSIAATEPSEAEIAQLRFLMAEYMREPHVQWAEVEQQARLLAPQTGGDVRRAAGMVLGNLAIQLGVRELLLSDESLRIQSVPSLNADDLHALIKRTLDPSRELTAVLAPNSP